MRELTRRDALEVSAAAGAAAVASVAVLSHAGAELFPQNKQPKPLGLCTLKSVHGRLLQGYIDHTIHASQKPDKRNTEETWALWEVDATKGLYGLQNYRSGRFLSLKQNGCVRSDSVPLADTETWRFKSGADAGIQNGIAVQATKTGNYLGTNPPGKDVKGSDKKDCNGQVTCLDGANKANWPPKNVRTWPGWWFLESCGPPEGNPGLGDIIKTAIDLAAVLKAIAK